MYLFVFILMAYLLIHLLTKVYRSNWSKNLNISMDFSEESVTEGDKSELYQTVTNQKLLPLWWGDLQFDLSNHIRFDGNSMDHMQYKKNTMSVMPYERIKKTLPFTADKRGYYTIQKAELLTGDLFFKYKFIKKYPVFTELYVCPNAKGMDKFSLDFKKIVGELITKRQLIEDPFEFRGIRDYTTSDSLKSVNWKATARNASLKVNEYHSTSSQQVCILLNFDGYHAWDDEKIREDMIRIAAYLTQEFIANGIPTGILANAADTVTREEIETSCLNGENQALTINRQLARIDADKTTRPFEQLLDEKVLPFPEPHYIMISYYSEQDLQNRVETLRQSGHSLQWILIRDSNSKTNIPNTENLTMCEADY